MSTDVLRTRDDILKLLAAFQMARPIAETLIVSRANLPFGWLDNLRAGRATLRSCEKMIASFSENWPADASWPSDVPRPVPAQTTRAA